MISDTTQSKGRALAHLGAHGPAAAVPVPKFYHFSP